MVMMVDTCKMDAWNDGKGELMLQLDEKMKDSKDTVDRQINTKTSQQKLLGKAKNLRNKKGSEIPKDRCKGNIQHSPPVEKENHPLNHLGSGHLSLQKAFFFVGYQIGSMPVPLLAKLEAQMNLACYNKE